MTSKTASYLRQLADDSVHWDITKLRAAALEMEQSSAVLVRLQLIAKDMLACIGSMDEMSDNERMRNTLLHAGYTDCGGELWKPPLGRRPVFLDENTRLRALIQDAITNMGAWEYDDLSNWQQRAQTALGSPTINESNNT